MPDDLLDHAVANQRRFEAIVPAAERKRRGHFGTPADVARLMAGMFEAFPAGEVRLLDPGAGVGTLSAAVCLRALTETVPRRIRVEAWENDPELVPLLKDTLNRCRDVLKAAGHDMEFVVEVDDFVLAGCERSLFRPGPTEGFHLAILNPPYFKLRGDSEQARRMEHVVGGQPNIYALFMAAAADLLLPEGEMVAVTPRSYFGGPYFRRFRLWLLDRLKIRRIHLFESRTETFKDDAVLQETVVLHAKRTDASDDVVVSTGAGRADDPIVRSSSPYDAVVAPRDEDRVIRPTFGSLEREILETVAALPRRFRDSGFRIATGPVVPFRSREWLREDRGGDTAPLLWSHNVRPFTTRVSARSGKSPHILVRESSRRLLVRAKTYVLLKRFTAKEERRRVVAGIVRREDSYSEWLGLENHLNYVDRDGADFEPSEALGLAAYFNSALVDRYIRSVSGNTQVNAAEIRATPLPDDGTLHEIGERLERGGATDPVSVERNVGAALKLPARLLERLTESA